MHNPTNSFKTSLLLRSILKICLNLFVIVFLNSCNFKNNKKSSAELKKWKDSVFIDSLLNLDAVKFEKALRLEATQSQQSISIYSEIIKSDSQSYWGKQSAVRTRYLKAAKAHDAYIKKLSGTWIWVWQGTNWGDMETPRKGVLERQLIIKENGELFFYENNKLVLADKYAIKTQQDYIGDDYYIELKKSKEIYTISLHENQLATSEPGCVCGCTTNKYIKKTK